MANTTLHTAKIAKNDEFYTQWQDIEHEMQAYYDFDSSAFRDKTILCPCDDPEWSNFTKFFALHFQEWGIKKLISTSFAQESKKYKTQWEPTLFETQNPLFDIDKTKVKGKIFVLEKMGGGIPQNIDSLKWQYLQGDGDFRSQEVTALRNEADIIITNPPFSLFREFLAWVVAGKKKFSVIANKNCITYKEVFPLIKANKIWTGVTSMSKDLLFHIPKEFQKAFVENGKAGSNYKIVNGEVLGRSTSMWLTNLEHGRRHKPLKLMTKEQVLRFSKHKAIRGKADFDHYDNYAAIDIPFTDAIPRDYTGVMGVPISFLDKYCPEQYELLGIGGNNVCVINGHATYKRLFIQKRSDFKEEE